MFTKLSRFIILLFWVLPIISAYPKNTEIVGINNLDSKFIKLSAAVYKDSPLITTSSYKEIKNIKILHQMVVELIKKNKYFEAIQLIKYKQNLIQKNIDDPAVFLFIDLLMTHNEWTTANNLYQYIKREGDKSLISNVKFIFSKYYFNRNKWKKTIKLLSGVINDLAVNDGYYALIMNGIALQNLKKHRQALKYYAKVSKTSPYYQYAQLNTALVYMRQGWWSDAHIIITTLIKEKLPRMLDKKEFTNRLYLVLGYSFLRQEYFREAREAFRNIQKDSRYANRALLGISLAAASQGDNIGSLNILNILQQKDPLALPVEETYLLLPYVYEKIGQHKTASASYSIALTYYQKRIRDINSILKNIPITRNINIKNNILIIKNNRINFREKHLVFFINNLKELRLFKSRVKVPALQSKINTLATKYNAMLKRIIIDTLKQRADYLKSYQNQSQYGLARLYDNSKSKSD